MGVIKSKQPPEDSGHIPSPERKTGADSIVKSSKVPSGRVQLGRVTVKPSGFTPDSKEPENMIPEASPEVPLVDETRLQAETVQTTDEAAIKSAYEEGYQKGFADAQDEVKQATRDMLAIIEEGRALNRTLQSHAEAASIEMAVAIAQRIIEDEVECHPERLRGFVEEAVKHVSQQDKLIFKVNPKEVAYLIEQKAYFKQKFPEIGDTSVQEDPSLEPGGCIIETNYGYVDASIKTKLAYIRQAMEFAIPRA